MAAVGPDKMSPGAEAIIQAVDRPDPRPIWITIWGGANMLAQALSHVRATRSPAEVDKFALKLRVSAISDQDDAVPWIRREFPGLHYIVKPSSPDGSEYYYATWTGISGDAYYRNCAGADSTTITNEWLEKHIRAKGPLGRLYPKFAFIMEGDTSRASVTATAAYRPNWIPANRPCTTGVAHIILAVTDNGSPALTSYRRVILNVSAMRSDRCQFSPRKPFVE